MFRIGRAISGILVGGVGVFVCGYVSADSRGYLTTPKELATIRQKAARGSQPYKDAVGDVLAWAARPWDFVLSSDVGCGGARDPQWINFKGGIPVLYAKALAYHLTGERRYAEEVRRILERIMTEVKSISISQQQCQLNFAWGTPELVASADLIEDYLKDQTCRGPTSTVYGENVLSQGNCKVLFQNWLVKNPYYVFSLTTTKTMSNWGAAATNAGMYIADYLADRPAVKLIHRNPPAINPGGDFAFSPAEAFRFIKNVTLKRMSMYGVDYLSTSCDLLGGRHQNGQWPPVKSGITEAGIVTEDARREEYCNIPHYNGEYQNYPEVHLGNLIQQCELMLRRGDASCYDNVDLTDIPEYKFVGPDGQPRTTHLYPGRGSLKRAIDAIVVDAAAEWKRPGTLAIAYRYYFTRRQLSETSLKEWGRYLGSGAGGCFQDVCFGNLTHGFARGEKVNMPPVVAPPGG